MLPTAPATMKTGVDAAIRTGWFQPSSPVVSREVTFSLVEDIVHTTTRL
jgi:hypothetical protein